MVETLEDTRGKVAATRAMVIAPDPAATHRQRQAAFAECEAADADLAGLATLESQATAAKAEANRLARQLHDEREAIDRRRSAASRTICRTADPLIAEAVAALNRYREQLSNSATTGLNGNIAQVVAKTPAILKAIQDISALSGIDYGKSARAAIYKAAEPLGVDPLAPPPVPSSRWDD